MLYHVQNHKSKNVFFFTNPYIRHKYTYIYLFYLDLPIAVMSSKWFICLFAEVLPIETVLRIWDCLFNEGSKVNFFMNFIVFIYF